MEGLVGSACWSFHNSQGGLTNGCLPNIGPGWHTFASDWEPGSLTYYYDGVEVKSLTTGITSSPMYIILGNGVHSDEAGVTEPDAMKVQYVRVWQH
jgi:beta-glucanase (GH16 family)